MQLALQFFWCAVFSVMGVAVAIAAVVGFIVLAHIGKETYEDRQKHIWRNEPPVEKRR